MSYYLNQYYLIYTLLVIFTYVLLLVDKDLGIKNVDIKRIVNIVTNNGDRVIEHPKKNMDSEVVQTIIESCL